jgi:hypothetical protein
LIGVGTVSLVKSGKTGAFGGVSRLNAALALAASLVLGGCASQAPATNPQAPDRIDLEPSDASYKSAVESLTPAEQKALKKGLGFTVDTLLVAPTPVEVMTWSRRRPDTPLAVNISAFVRFLDQQPALGGGTRVNLATARVLAGLTYDQAVFDPVFRIQVEVEPSTGSVMTATAVGAGPKCSRPADESPPDSPKLVESEQIAFMKAFLKTLLKINQQLQQT